MSTTFRPLRDSDGNLIDHNHAFARGVTRSFATSTTSAQSTADFSPGTQYVELSATVFSYYKLSTAGDSAALTDTPLPPNVTRIVPTGGKPRLAAILASTSGRIHATEL